MKNTLYTVVWFILLVAAIWWNFRPAPAYVAPSGWRYWSETDAVFDFRFEDKEIVIAGKRGVYRLSPDDRLQQILLKGFDLQPIAFAVERDARGRLWVWHEQGLQLFDGEEQHLISQLNGEPLKDIKDILITSDGLAYVAAGNGLYKLSNPTADDPVKDAEQLLPDQRVMVLKEDVTGNIWVGTTTGLYLVQQGRITTSWKVEDGLPNRRIASLMQDSESNVWVGTGFHDRGGTLVMSQTNEGWQIAKQIPTELLAAAKTRSLFQDGKGRVWLGSETAGLVVLAEGKQLLKLTMDNGLPNQEVTVIKQSKDGAIWLATLSGLVAISPDGLEKLFPEKN